MHRAISVALAVVLAAGCAGDRVERAGPKADVGHGSVEEVTAALDKEGLPCTKAQAEPLDGLEQALSCSIGTSRITIVHFFGVEQSREYEQRVRDAGDHGVFADTWAAEVPTEDLAERIAAAVESRGYV